MESYLSFLLYTEDSDDDRYRVTPDPGRDAREAELRDTEERLGAPDKLLSLVFETGVRVLGADPGHVRQHMKVLPASVGIGNQHSEQGRMVTSLCSALVKALKSLGR